MLSKKGKKGQALSLAHAIACMQKVRQSTWQCSLAALLQREGIKQPTGLAYCRAESMKGDIALWAISCLDSCYRPHIVKPCTKVQAGCKHSCRGALALCSTVLSGAYLTWLLRRRICCSLGTAQVASQFKGARFCPIFKYLKALSAISLDLKPVMAVRIALSLPSAPEALMASSTVIVVPAVSYAWPLQRCVSSSRRARRL